MAENKVRFLRGTAAEYANAVKDDDTFYYTTDDEKFYVGSKEITGGGITVDTALSDTSTNSVQNKVIKQAIDNTVQIIDFGNNQIDTKVAVGQSGKTVIYRCSNWTDYPNKFPDGQGTLIAINYNGAGVAGTNTIWCDQFIISPRDDHLIFKRIIDGGEAKDWEDYRNGGDANTVNGHSVNSDVPADAVFTDTVPTSLPANGGNADYATNAGNADTVDNLHASDFAKSANPTIEGNIQLVRAGNSTTTDQIFAWENGIRIRCNDENAENTTYADLIVQPNGIFTEGWNNGTMYGRYKFLNESDIQTNIAGNTIFVKSGTNFPTINSAIAKAVSEQKSYSIYISDGTYIEDLDLRDIGNITLEFVGVGNVSISSDTAYPQGALYCMSNCSFRNISFFASNSYAVHIEFNNAINSNGDYATYKNIRFENCVFGSGWTQCVGIGLGQSCTATFTNCVMQTSFYAHNQAKSNVSGQGIRLNGCQIYGGIQIDDAAYSNGFSNSVINIAVTNTAATEFVFVKDRSGSEWVTYNYIPNGDANVILDVVSGGNSYALNNLNNGFSVKKYEFDNVTVNSTVTLGHLDKLTLSLPVDYTSSNTIVGVSTDINTDWVMLGTGILTSNSYVIPYYNYYTNSISGKIILTIFKF